MVCYQVLNNNIINEGIFIIDDLPELELVNNNNNDDDDLPELISASEDDDDDLPDLISASDDDDNAVNPAEDYDEDDNEPPPLLRDAFHINWLHLFTGNNNNNNNEIWSRDFTERISGEFF